MPDLAAGPGIKWSGTITGRDGANTLRGFGGTGNDTLPGGVGDDDDIFDTALNGTGNGDKIVGDFIIVA